MTNVKIHKIDIPISYNIVFNGEISKKIDLSNNYKGELSFTHGKLAGVITVENNQVGVVMRVNSIERISLIKLKAMIAEYEKKHGLI